MWLPRTHVSFLLLILWSTAHAQYQYVRQSCGADDFRCDNGKCIARDRRCDGVVDCSNEEDEINCDCRSDEFRCVIDGSCIEARKKCDGINHCKDNSDEIDCATGYFQCRSGKFIPENQRCNRRYDCPPGDYSDEQNCRASRCPADSFTCNIGSINPCGKRCDGQVDCDGGEDEHDCACSHECDGRCLEEDLICNDIPDCSDGSDELNCDNCDGPDDFRCNSGECLNAAQHCNGLRECSDFSDELECNQTMIPTSVGCPPNQFRCNDGSCIDEQFVCDGNQDCNDNSDEERCRCDENSWQCLSGPCIPSYKRCDSYPDCSDGSDEAECPTSRPFPTPAPFPTASPFATPAPFPTSEPYTPPYYIPPQTPRPVFPTPDRPEPDARLGPSSLNLKTYPDTQTIRSAKYQYGGDVVFQCRDEGPLRAPVRWIREGGRSLKPGATDRNGRLEMNRVTMADNGVYICQAPKYLGYPGSEMRVTLNIDPSPVTQSPPFLACQPHEATCGNGQCIPKTAVCDFRYDCSDRSDEIGCTSNGMCEPNQFQCTNRRCVFKYWMCDSEDDCGDGSDEQNCYSSKPGDPCLPVEFSCSSREQCVPKSFHCDGQTDCMDGSDEIGCAPVHIIKPPTPSNVKLNPGDTLTLTCEAVGIPVPLVTWRLNWGHVPPKCTSTSNNGVGVLTCTNMQPEDSGAYSCEAINNKGTIFAVPDALVYVNQTDVCRNGYFNSEARSESECIRCFCFGESTQCHSADLFTYNMPTPLGEGGTRLIGVKQNYTGEIQIDPQPITDQYYYQPLRNGATVTKLVTYSYISSTAHPYLTLPETYNGNQLTSYGGNIKYTLSPHSLKYGFDNNLPDIIIKGKYETLVHTKRRDNSRETYLEARLTPENWQKASDRGLIPTSREDLMMALDNIEMILLRADLNDAGVNITDFAMESAQHINVGLGAANLVEECTCPPGYEGLSCEKCAVGYVREKSGPWLGNCVPEERPCPPGTYGNSYSGCRPCPCPLTNRENQFASTCSITYNGDVVCDCAPGYEGSHCEYCAPGYVGNPLIVGDSCKPQQSDNCNPVGTVQIRLPDECECKENVQGRYCDQCKNNSFYLSTDFRHGCAACFCSGVSQQCTSSSLRRKTTSVAFNVPQIVDQVKVYSSAPVGPSGAIRYNAPIETPLVVQPARGEAALSNFDRAQSAIYYWSLPPTFTGDKVTSYGGYLTYTVRHIPTPGGQSSRNNAADVQLISDNRLTFRYFGNFAPSNNGILNASVQFLEKGWQRPDGKEVSRELFLLALADVKAILVKATYTTNTELASIMSASIDTAEPNGDGPLALHVEQCICPTGYVGTSCEDCAPGYTRSSSGLYLEHCGLCDCNGHSSMCHPETGVCSDCAHNTAGPNCELCRPGYEKDNRGNCVPSYEPEVPTCNCDARGSEVVPCDVTGRCLCKQNVEGEYCDHCRPGTFGLDANNRLGCLPCYCSGITNDCHEGTHYTKIPIPAPIFGENYGGYALMDRNAEEVIQEDLVPAANESELIYVFSNPPRRELFWSLPVFPGNRLLSYGGTLSVTQKFRTSGQLIESEPGNDVILVGESYSIYWTNPNRIRSGESLTYQVPLREDNWYVEGTVTPVSRNIFMTVLRDLKRVLVRATLHPDLISTAIADVSMDTASESYAFGLPAAKSIEVCMCPQGYTGTSCEGCASGYYKYDSKCLPCNCNGFECTAGPYGEQICQCRPPYTGRDCSTLETNVETTTSIPPVNPPTLIVRITSPTIRIQEVGSSIRFKCEAQSRYTSGQLPVSWSKVNGYLPEERTQIDQRTGLLYITNLQISDSGEYICQTSDGISTAQATATLKVPGNTMVIPTVTIKPSTVNEYYEGERIQLECVAVGNPTPRIIWQRGSNRPLPLATEHYEAYLIIEDAKVEDSGEYRCVASNPAGSTDRTAIVTVRPRPSWPSRDTLTITPTSPNVVEGQSTRVVCTGTANVPPGSIGWIRQDGSNLLSNVRSDNGVLYVDVARLENQGVYVCQTSSSEVSPVPILLTVIPLSTQSPAEASNITIPLNHVKIPTGGSEEVPCTPLGYPPPLIKWRKHDDSFGPGVSQRDNSLIISNAREEDQGYYVCEGIVDGNTISNIYLFVEIEKREPPRVEIWPQGEQAVTLDSVFEFRCRVLGGIPTPDITWDRSGGRQLSPHTQILSSQVLRFQKIEVNDEGEYTCTASNIAGKDSASAVLKVRSTPEITIIPNNYIEVVQGDEVNIICRASGYPEPMVSIKSGRDYRDLVPPTPAAATLNIRSVNERDDGEYTCVATSAAGTVEQQIIIRVDRGDGGFGEEPGSGEEEFRPDVNYVPNYPDSRNIVGVEDRNITIDCAVTSLPSDAEIIWFRSDRQPLQWNAKQDGSNLVIYNAAKSDAGEYECAIRNREGEVLKSAHTNIVIKSAPKITLRPTTQTVHPGESPIVECIVEGDEIIDISWKPVNRPFSRRVEPRGSTLIFHKIEVEDAGEYMCNAINRVSSATAVAEVIVNGASEEPQALVSIDQPRSPFRVGENVEILCRARSRGVTVNWERYGTKQYVNMRKYGDGAMLVIPTVEESDAGVYRCSGRDNFGRTSYEDFNLEVQPGLEAYSPTSSDQPQIYTARVRDSIDMICNHNLEEPVSIEWRRDYVSLPSGVRKNEPYLRLSNVTEADAGVYVCRVSNSRTAVEVKPILKVIGVVPRFDGNSWLALPTLKDAYRQFDIEISFKPTDNNGLLLYNSQNEERSSGDFLALQLVNGIPQFILDLGLDTGPIQVTGDRPLALNTWHTIRLSKTNSKVTMDVDNTGPFTSVLTGQWTILDLNKPLYIGGVPDYSKLPSSLTNAGFIGCVSMLILGREEKNIVVDSIDRYNINECDSCTPNLCLNNGICQEALNERGYICICAEGFVGLHCNRTGEACHPGLCGRGKCTDTADGYKCACPVTFTGRNCDVQQTIEYPAFTGSAYLAIKIPEAARTLRISMKIKATAPVTDGIIVYCANSARGYGGFTSLAVHDGRLEFRYDLGDGNGPVVLTSDKLLQPNEWTDVFIARSGAVVSLRINFKDKFEKTLTSPEELSLKTPLFVGGVDDSIILNNNTGVTGGFSGCIKDVVVYGDPVNIVNSSIQSANVQECSNYDRGDIPEDENYRLPSQMESVCSQCRNGGYCLTPESTACTCPPGYTGLHCENRVPYSAPRSPSDDPCALRPCRNSGICKPNRSTRLGYACDCPLGFAGTNCQMRLELLQSVGFNGNGYLELPAQLLNYNNLESEPALIALAIHTTADGVLLYQREALASPNVGDFILLRVEHGLVILDWDLGGGLSTVSVDNIYVNDGDRHEIIAKLHHDSTVSLSVDGQTRRGISAGFSNIMNVDSNIYIGGIPDNYNVQRLPGFTGCFEQIELMDSKRGLNLGQVAVTGRNTQRCK